MLLTMPSPTVSKVLKDIFTFKAGKAHQREKPLVLTIAAMNEGIKGDIAYALLCARAKLEAEYLKTGE